MAKSPKKLSPGEEGFFLHCRASGLFPEREYKFCEDRKWRFDFAFPEDLIAIEIEGAVWSAGRHTRGSGYIADLDKYNSAARLGWRVFRFTTDQVAKGLAIDFVSSLPMRGR